MSKKGTSIPRNSILSRFLTAIERIGNALPHPATLFAILAFGLILLSWLFSKLGVDQARSVAPPRPRGGSASPAS